MKFHTRTALWGFYFKLHEISIVVSLSSHVFDRAASPLAAGACPPQGAASLISQKASRKRRSYQADSMTPVRPTLGAGDSKASFHEVSYERLPIA
jgi:hypothetical protein